MGRRLQESLKLRQCGQESRGNLQDRGEEHMVELFMMEYLTVLGMTMVLLFLDSRYSRRRTIFVACGVIVLVMAAVAVIYREIGAEATIRIYSLIAHIPSLLLVFVLSRFRGWRLVFQLLSAILFMALLPVFEALFNCITDYRLRELTDHDAPLMRELNSVPG